ncbi:hypothetical protein AVEN_206290-1 [Araneus ventricosus]|uniref:Uncharacterized protein n=1 Tax=Araneus ventricosus TaxID=182803 RepID=A0A4Y2S8H7_ARAVE|nr:hypothetical protein AVEN_206290-1 [Araneus ventricosus]
MTPLNIKLPKCHLENVLRAMMINAWKKNWDEGKSTTSCRKSRFRLPTGAEPKCCSSQATAHSNASLKGSTCPTHQTAAVVKRAPQFSMQQIAS